VFRAKIDLETCIALLATVDFSGHGISPSLCGFALQISGCRVTRPLNSGKSAAARLREFFLGEMAFKTPGYWQGLRNDPFWNLTEVLQSGQLLYGLRT
jgi:hypothetical protein